MTVHGLPLTSLGKRLLAYVVESLLVAVTLCIGWLVWSVAVWGSGRTPAKQLLRMRVVTVAEGHAATWPTMLLREIGVKWLPGVFLAAALNGLVATAWFVIAALFIFARPLRQPLWDRVTATVVVDDD